MDRMLRDQARTRFSLSTMLLVTALISTVLAGWLAVHRESSLRTELVKETSGLLPPDCGDDRLSAKYIQRVGDCWIWNLKLPRHTIATLRVEVLQNTSVVDSLRDDVFLRGFDNGVFAFRRSNYTPACVSFSSSDAEVHLGGGSISTRHTITNAYTKFLDGNRFTPIYLPNGDTGTEELELLRFISISGSSESMRLVLTTVHQ